MSMDIGPRHHGAASARIRLCPGLDPKLQDSTRELCDLSTPQEHQGRGHASALLRDVCREADEAGVMLVLFVDPFGAGLSAGDLAAWYGRHGFAEIQAEPVRMMARQIGATPRMLGAVRVSSAQPARLYDGVNDRWID